MPILIPLLHPDIIITIIPKSQKTQICERLAFPIAQICTTLSLLHTLPYLYALDNLPSFLYPYDYERNE